MALRKTRTYQVDFYRVEQVDVDDTDLVRNLLKNHVNGHAPAHCIDNNANIQFQIRDIAVASQDANIYKGVFGRLRHNETPEQASATGADADVQLLPGHGLVEKNYFLFFSDLNLIAFHRKAHAGRNSHLQAYLNSPQFAQISLTQILTTDSYSKLLNGDALKKVEISLRKPAAALHQEDSFLSPLINQFQGHKPAHMKVVLSAEKGGSLPAELKESLIKLARFGRTRVARASLVDDTLVDLLMDRLVGNFVADLQSNGRTLPTHMFAGIASAKDECADDLENFFHP